MTNGKRPPDPGAPGPMKPPRPGSSEGKTVVDPRPPFEVSEEVTLEYRPEHGPLEVVRKEGKLELGRKPAPLETDVTLEYRGGAAKAPAEMELKLNPMPYVSDLTPEHNVPGAEPGPRYVELGAERHFEETPYDLQLPPRFSELTPESDPGLTEESPLHPARVQPPPKPQRSHDRVPHELRPRLLPADLTPEGESVDEYHPPLSDPVSASEITKLPDVKRALEALRAGKMLKSPGAQPYGPPATGPDSKPTQLDRGTPSSRSKPRTPTTRPAPEQSIERARMTLALLGVVGWLVAVGLVVLYALRPAPLGSPPAQPSPVVRASAPAAPSPQPASEDSAETAALQRIAETPVADLTPEHWVVLARERNRKRRDELKALVAKVHVDEPPSAETIARLRDAVRDSGAAPDALLAMVNLRGTIGPDLIYQVANDERLPPETRGLGLDLLGTKVVRGRASEALSVVLDLGRIKSCEEAEQAVMRAVKVGDRRALGALNRLYSTRGCGPDKASDCYPCLRRGNRLNHAVEMARTRQPPG